MYKLIALDMDGTLLNDKKEITKENIKAIKMARSKGVKVILATGRPRDGVRHYLKELDMLSGDEYVVAFNGGLVQHCGTGEIISQINLELKDYEILLDLSEELGCNVQALTESEVLTPKISVYSKIHAEVNDIPLKECLISELSKDTIIAKVMFIDDEQVLDEVIPKIPQDIREKYTVIRSGERYLEFLHKDVNKGVGVMKVAERLNISQEEVICMGDAENDLHMLQYAGLSIAMGNAFESIKELADYVTLSNEDSGVAHAIEKFIL